MTRVIVVGAGIGGLALAAALRRERIEPIVLERSPRLDAAGAGISLAPNAIRALDALGLADEVRRRGAPPAARSRSSTAPAKHCRNCPPP